MTEPLTYSALETLKSLYWLSFEPATTKEECEWYRSTFANMCERYGLDHATAQNMLEVLRVNR